GWGGAAGLRHPVLALLFGQRLLGAVPGRGGAVPPGAGSQTAPVGREGPSAGSLIAAAVVCGISLDDLKEFFFSTVKEVRNTILGPFSPKCSLLANIKAVLQRMLPEDSYQLASGRLHISLTRVVDGQNVMASEFSSKEELIQALLCSCFLPVYCGFIPPSYRGVRYVDGGFTGLQPVSSLEEAVITVSPFTGELDICPRDCPATFFCFQIFNGSIQISMENLLRISYALFPPSTVVLNDFFSQGYQDTALFLYRNNAFGFNYCDGNFRFASMCGRNDFAQSNRTVTSLCKMVPQCLSTCVLAGLAVWRKQQVAGLQDPLSKVLLQSHRLPAPVRKG
ncbi:patatin-like phospholipase domain containing 1, partial [Columba livia]